MRDVADHTSTAYYYLLLRNHLNNVVFEIELQRIALVESL